MFIPNYTGNVGEYVEMQKRVKKKERESYPYLVIHTCSVYSCFHSVEELMHQLLKDSPASVKTWLSSVE
jgi:hypothetical protein